MSIRNCNIYATKSELQEMFNFVYTELKTNDFKVKQSALRDDFSYALTKGKRKWSSLLSSASDEINSYTYHKSYAERTIGFNKYSLLALEEAIEIQKRKKPLAISIEDYANQIEFLLKTFKDERSISSIQELDEFIEENFKHLAFEELVDLWFDKELYDGALPLYVFCKHLGVSEISKKAFKKFIQSDWDFYFNEDEYWSNNGFKSARQIIEQLLELDYVNFKEEVLLEFVARITELLQVRTPEVKFYNKRHLDVEALQVSVEPFAFNDLFIEESNKMEVGYANSLTLVKSKFYESVDFDVPIDHKGLEMYLAEIYNSTADSIYEVLSDAMLTIEPDLKEFDAVRFPLCIDNPEIDAFYAQLKESIFYWWGDSLSNDMLNRLKSLPANPAKQLKIVANELKLFQETAYDELTFWEYFDSFNFLNGHELLNIDYISAEVRIDKSVCKDWDETLLGYLDGITKELINLLHKHFEYEFSLIEVSSKELTPWKE